MGDEGARGRVALAYNGLDGGLHVLLAEVGHQGPRFHVWLRREWR